MATQDETDRLRAALLRALYEAAGGATRRSIALSDLAESLNVAMADAEAAGQFLVDRRLAKWETFGPTISITPTGVDQVERWNREREKDLPPRRLLQRQS